MRTRISGIGSVLFLTVLALSLYGQAVSPLGESLADVDKMLASFKVETVIGAPIAAGGTTVIPFYRVKFSLGAGGAMMGFGAGMGGKAVPMGFLVIQGDEVKVELLPVEEKKPGWFQQMLPTLLQMLPMLQGGKTPAPAPPAPPAPKSEAKAESASPAASLKEAEQLMADKKFPEALAAVDALLAKDPNCADSHALKGSIMGNMAQGNPMDMMKYGMGAMQEFETALGIDPNNVRAHFGRGMGRLQAPPGFGGDYDGAVADFKFVTDKKPSAEAYYYLGQAYAKKGSTAEAKECYKKALALKPDYQAAANALAETR